MPHYAAMRPGEQAQLIDDLGGSTATARLIETAIVAPFDRSRVSKWKEHNYVPPAFRLLLAQIARRKRIRVPDGFVDPVTVARESLEKKSVVVS